MTTLGPADLLKLAVQHDPGNVTDLGRKMRELAAKWEGERLATRWARKQANDLERFSIEHGGTLKNHKAWMRLTRDLATTLNGE